MATEALPPFSARNRGSLAQIDNDFPESARMGLLHIIRRGVEVGYLRNWIVVARELQRIARVAPRKYEGETWQKDAETDVFRLLNSLPWQRIYDFCERLYSFLAEEGAEARRIIADEVQLLFQEENLAFDFRNGYAQRRGRRHTVAQVSKADAALAADARLESARGHFSKAQRYFQDREHPDPENVVKEAVCAVEAAAKELFPDIKAPTLDDAVRQLTGTEFGKLPPAIAKTFTGLYGFRGAGEGVAHGGATGGEATIEIAEYVLALAASQIVLLADLARAKEDEIPF